MPDAIAADQQTHVPMIVWTSEAYRQRTGWSLDCQGARQRESLSHDNLYNTVLGMTDVRDAAYDPALDIFATCRAGDAR